MKFQTSSQLPTFIPLFLLLFYIFNNKCILVLSSKNYKLKRYIIEQIVLNSNIITFLKTLCRYTKYKINLKINFFLFLFYFVPLLSFAPFLSFAPLLSFIPFLSFVEAFYFFTYFCFYLLHIYIYIYAQVVSVVVIFYFLFS